MSKKNYQDIVVNSLPERELEIVGSITSERMSELRERAIKKFKDSVEIPGFRKGMAPDNLVVSKVGEMTLLEEGAEIALNEEYPNILAENKIDAIGRPEISITKLAPGNPLEFKIKTSLLPEVKLTDYKKIAEGENKKEKATPEATEKEVDDVIENMRKNIAHQKLHANQNLDEHSHDHAEIKDEDLPKVDDDFAKMLGDFKNVSELREKIRENIVFEKELKEKDKLRTRILEEIIEKSKIELPKILIEGEQEKMLAGLEDDLARNGLQFDEYLKHIKKTKEDLKVDWRETAVKRAKSQVVLNNIAKDEGISPKEEEIKKEVDGIISHHKDADRFRVRIYVETFLTNELVFQFLEKQ